MKKTSVTKKFTCEFCNRAFARETTLLSHSCEPKRRWNDRDSAPNRIGLQCWHNFYAKNTVSKKKKTYMDFIKSAYYSAFVKFGLYCVNVAVINPLRYSDWLLENSISVDDWCQDSNYTRYLVEYLKAEDPFDAIARSIETTLKLSRQEGLVTNDYLRYGNKNKICYEITAGRISPWMLYQSESGQNLLDSLDESQVRSVFEYIDPEKWAVKFKRYPDVVKQINALLTEAGY